MNYVGIDIGGTNIKAGLIDESGKVHKTLGTLTIVDDLDGLISSLSNLLKEFQASANIDAVGIGIPGLRNTRTHRIETSPNIPCVHNLNLEELLSKPLKLPVITENDANAGAYGEWVCGAGRNLQFMAYITIGTGLGGGLILNGALYRGACGFAGELGHVNIDPMGRQCACGARGCLETRVSAHGIVETAQEYMRNTKSTLHSIPHLTAEIIYERALAGDAAAAAAFQDTGISLGIACADLINLLNLEMIVVGGGVMASGKLLLGSAIAEVQRRAFAPAARICPIVQSQLWPNAGMIGAAMLARDRQ